MKFIKTFENFDGDLDEDLDEDLLLNYLQYLTDEHNLLKIEDTRFLRQGYLFINSDNFQEGYFYRVVSGDKDSTNYRDKRSKFYLTIIKRSYEKYPEAMNSDKGEYFLKTEYPKLYSDLENYKSHMKRLHKSNEFEYADYMTTYRIIGRGLSFYQIDLTFELRRLKKEETPDYQVMRMLK
jgi:hypothetical protein